MLEYQGSKATQGYNPDGTPIDTSEIYQQSIVQRALQSLGIDDSIDYIRNNITVEPLISDDEYNMHDAKVELGEEYDLIATRYLVTLTVDHSRGEDYAYTVLNQILDEYVEYYAEKHVNTSNLVSGLDKYALDRYDYIELTEIIDDTIDSTLQSLDSKIGYDDQFRQTSTGYSFSDLYREFQVLRNNRTSKLMAEILCYRVTKNRNVLMSKYTVRNENLSIENEGNSTAIDDVVNIISDYVDKMQASGNTDITSDYILGEVYDQDLYDNKNVDQTTEYDILLNNYVKARTNYSDNTIDYGYNTYVMNTFMSGDPCTDENIISNVETELKDLLTEIQRLFDIANETNVEFNNYLGAKNIKVLQNVYVQQSLPVKQFTVIVFALCLMCQTILFIVALRISDIIHSGMKIYTTSKNYDDISNVQKDASNFQKDNENKHENVINKVSELELIEKSIQDENFKQLDI